MPMVATDSNHAKENAYGIRQPFQGAGQYQPDIAYDEFVRPVANENSNPEKAHHRIGRHRLDSAKYNSGCSEAFSTYRRRGSVI